jgi:hypothetical protein
MDLRPDRNWQPRPPPRDDFWPPLPQRPQPVGNEQQRPNDGCEQRMQNRADTTSILIAVVMFLLGAALMLRPMARRRRKPLAS